MNIPTTDETMACEFAVALLATLGPRKFERVKALNSERADPSTCASHDFVDANMVMFAVMDGHGFGDLEGEENRRRWNTVWDLAYMTYLLKGSELP